MHCIAPDPTKIGLWSCGKTSLVSRFDHATLKHEKGLDGYGFVEMGSGGTSLKLEG